MSEEEVTVLHTSKMPFTMLFNILLPLLHCFTVFVAHFFQYGSAPLEIIKAVVFTLFFDFILVFYCNLNKEKVLTGFVSLSLLISLPVIGFYSSSLSLGYIYSIVIIVLGSLSGILVDLIATIITLTGLFSYMLIFTSEIYPDTVVSISITIIIILLSMLESGSKNLLILIPTVSVSVIIALLIKENLILSGLIALPNIIILLLAILMTFLCCILKDALSEDFTKILTIEAENTVADLPPVSEASKESSEPVIAREEYMELLNENKKLKDKVQLLSNSGSKTIEECISLTSDYAVFLKQNNSKIYTHCIEIARLSSEAASIIGCDSDIACAIGIYHEAKKVLGEDYINILINEYRIPKYIVRSIELIKNKENTLPMIREAGLVLLSDDITNTLSYLRNNNREDISMDRIVYNAFKLRNDKNHLRLAGFTKEEIQLLKIYFNDIGGTYDAND